MSNKNRMNRPFDDDRNFAKALACATHEHDGAWRDPMAMEMIAEHHNVDLDRLIRAARNTVELREKNVMT